MGRDSVFEDLLSESVDPYKRMTTSFLGEPGVDAGGLTREMWCLFSKGVQQLCDGKETCKVPRHNTIKLQEGVFKKIGLLMGISIGSGFLFFSPSVCKYFSSKGNFSSISPEPEEIADEGVFAMLQKVLV